MNKSVVRLLYRTGSSHWELYEAYFLINTIQNTGHGKNALYLESMGDFL